jgi:hypothetical protein
MLDTTSYTARLVYSDIKAGNSSGSAYIPEADGTMPFVLVAPGPNHGGMDSAAPDFLVVSITPTGTLSWDPLSFYAGISSGETMILIYVCDEQV